MLKINIRQIDNDGISFSGVAPLEILELGPGQQCSHDAEFTQPVKYDLHVSLVSGGILVAGRLSTKASCNCGRCLEVFDFDISNIEVCHFFENYTMEELDIAPELREDILISLPMKLICREDCPGITIKNKRSAAERQAAEKFNAENDVWKDLDGLKL